VPGFLASFAGIELDTLRPAAEDPVGTSDPDDG